MSTTAFKAPRFATHTAGQPFFQILTQRVNQYFKENQKSPKGDLRLYTKTGVLLAAFFATYVAVLYFGANFWVALPFWVILVFVAGFVFISSDPPVVLFALFVIYGLSGWGVWLWRWRRQGQLSATRQQR